MTRIRLILTTSLLFCAAGCVAVGVESKARMSDSQAIARHYERLLQPFQAGITIYCQRLTVDVSAAFANRLAFPAGGSQSRGKGLEQIVWNATDRVKIRARKGRPGSLAEPREQKFHVVIGTSHFVVDELIRVKKLLSAAPTLTATAAGHVLVLKDAKQIERYQEVRFAQGRMRTR